MPEGLVPVVLFLVLQTGALIWWASKVNTLIGTYENRITNVEGSTSTIDKRIQESRHLVRNETVEIIGNIEDRLNERIDNVERRRNPR